MLRSVTFVTVLSYNVRLCIHIRIRMHIPIRVRILIRICVYVYACICVYVYVCICVICVYIYIYTCVLYIYIYMCKCVNVYMGMYMYINDIKIMHLKKWAIYGREKDPHDIPTSARISPMIAAHYPLNPINHHF